PQSEVRSEECCSHSRSPCAVSTRPGLPALRIPRGSEACQSDDPSAAGGLVAFPSRVILKYRVNNLRVTHQRESVDFNGFLSIHWYAEFQQLLPLNANQFQHGIGAQHRCRFLIKPEPPNEVAIFINCLHTNLRSQWPWRGAEKHPR